MPVSLLRSRTRGAPSAASHSGACDRRPLVSTTTLAGRMLPSSRRTPVTVGRPPFASPTRPLTVTPSRSSTVGIARTLSRSAHSKVARRQARRTTSSSSGRGSNAISGGAIAARPISRTPPARSRSRTSGMWASRIIRTRARNACEWRNCATPLRSQPWNASPGLSTSRRSSRSRTTTRRKWRARRRAAASPATPPPSTIADSLSQSVRIARSLREFPSRVVPRGVSWESGPG